MKTKEQKKHYDAVHRWLSRNHGIANRCESNECRKVSIKFTYALKHGCKYKRNRKNFLMLCVSCHRRYDGFHKGFCQKGHNYKKDGYRTHKYGYVICKKCDSVVQKRSKEKRKLTYERV